MFENRYTFSKQRVLEWVKHPIRRSPFVYIWIVLMVFSVAFLALSLLIRDWANAGFAVILSMFCAYRAFFHRKLLAVKQFDSLVKLYGKAEWERVIQLGDQIVVHDHNSVSQFEWAQITQVLVTKDAIALMFSKMQGLRLDRQGFSIGTDDAFLEHIKREYPHIKFAQTK